MRFGHGRAFLQGVGDTLLEVPVTKQWRTMEGRTFLVEAIPVARVSAALRRLSRPHGASVAPVRDSIRHVVSVRRQWPAPRLARTTPKDAAPMQMAQAMAPSQGLVLDWTAVNTATNWVFEANTTYYVSGSVSIDGAVFEGGTVLKYLNSTNVKVSVTGPVVWKTGPYRPAVFTSKNDNSVGETLSGSTGAPSSVNGATYLELDAEQDGEPLSYLRMAYAGVGVQAGCWDVPLWHSQFVQCQTAVRHTDDGLVLELDNVLVSRCGTLAGGSVTNLAGTHVTIDQLDRMTDAGVSVDGQFTNSILSAVTNAGTLSLESSVEAASAAGVFQTVGGASYYLVDSSTNRDAGTSALASNLLAALALKTTYPPLVYSNVTLTTNLTLGPAVARDTNTPDLGFHYDVLDYAFGGSHAYAELTFTAGTAVGWFRTSSGWYHAGHGIHIGDQHEVSFEGTLNAPDYWVRCCTVQEGCNGYWEGGYGPGGISGWTWPYLTNAPTVRACYTRFATLATEGNHFRDDWGYLLVRVRDSEFWGGSVGGYIYSAWYTNCLFDRTSYWLYGGRPETSLTMQNGTFHGGQFLISRSTSYGEGYTPIVLRDIAFDGTAVSTADPYASNASLSDYNYNAFLTNGSLTTPQGSNDVLVSSFDWETGNLGDFYLPTNSLLIDAGSVTNASLLGLYHYTTTTNQVKEGTTSRWTLATTTWQ